MTTRTPALGSHLLLVGAIPSLIVSCGRSPANSDGQSPADEEFVVAMKRAKPLAARINGDIDLFFENVHRFGPLDLVVEKSPDAKYCDEIRNYFLGAMAGAAKIDRAAFKRKLNDFHCGPPCARARRDALYAHLDAVRRLVTHISKPPSAPVVALWPGGGYRVGDIAFREGHFGRIQPSPVLGLIPWETFSLTDGLDVYFARMKTSRYKIEALVNEMRQLGIVALCRDEEGTRAVIKDSIGDNEAGLLFVASGAPPPQVDTRLEDGRQIVGFERVAEDVYFYTSS